MTSPGESNRRGAAFRSSRLTFPPTIKKSDPPKWEKKTKKQKKSGNRGTATEKGEGRQSRDCHQDGERRGGNQGTATGINKSQEKSEQA